MLDGSVRCKLRQCDGHDRNYRPNCFSRAIVGVLFPQFMKTCLDVVELVSQKRISERIIEDCPCASASDFGRYLRVAPASPLDSTFCGEDSATERRFDGGNCEAHVSSSMSQRLGFWK